MDAKLSVDLKLFDELLDKVVIELNDDDYVATPAEEGNPELDELCWAMTRFTNNLLLILEESVDAVDVPRLMVWEPRKTDVVKYKVTHDAPMSPMEIQLLTRLNNLRDSSGLSRIITIPTTDWEDDDA